MLALAVFRDALSVCGELEPTTLYWAGIPVERKTTSASWPPPPPAALQEVIVHSPEGTVYEGPPETPVWTIIRSAEAPQGVSAPA